MGAPTEEVRVCIDDQAPAPSGRPVQRLAAREGAQAGDDPREWRRHCVPRLMLDVCPLMGREIPRPPALGVANLENGALGVEMKVVSVRVLAAIGPHDFERHSRTLPG